MIVPLWISVLALFEIVPLAKTAVVVRNVNVNVNESVLLECEIPSGQISAIWYRDGVRIAVIPASHAFNITFVNASSLSNRAVLIQPTTSDKMAKLNITRTLCTDQGSYYCRTVSVTGEEPIKAEINLDVRGLPTTPQVNVLPEVVAEFNTVNITCMANVGKPASQLNLFHIMKNGRSVNLNGSQSKPVEIKGACAYRRTVQVTLNMTSENGGFYNVKCSSKPSLSGTARIKVQYPVREITIIKLPDDSIDVVSIGSSLSLLCKIKANPKANFSWYFKSVSVEKRISNQKEIKILYFNNDDVGQYTCEASNTVLGVEYNISKARSISIALKTTPKPTTISMLLPVSSSIKSDLSTEATKDPIEGRATKQKDKNLPLIIGLTIGACLLTLLIVLFIIFYRRRSKPTEIEEPPEKPRNNHNEVNVMETKPDLIKANDRTKQPNYNNAFDHKEDGFLYSDLVFDDTPRNRKPLVSPSNVSDYVTVMPQV